ncbi:MULTISPECIES: acetoin dehydrogenase dihydrolipoyllysine-residue acetyltransferase subunit [unclassified Bradyrhizobium]|uniref:acetoin dehydrogenase dihydrolipoyllysine-residue acetyltransferase subunit n=1 Tax=unclassified Bradyrhizobium TaxID=2631580 RepID=UPI001CD788A5|nr:MULTISPECIES: acetoin dehydrogenase dihydrolipoyllysine-residue acetyltransferase subunit [unclassified Bradyrhizobium]MCA1378948.1 acetoin dehydrogenase dihydrolipoyllysine-residue acetyltransferase subunit [Bradyrhizobium sp. IC4060]MCA1489120.1 acetoin dehydrogenase dihydrolipoyllysine-residue acetyltransferase subunit [Bradyrhizobium sp. IC4061]
MSRRAPEIVAIRMPKWGLSMDEGVLVSWSKSEGQRFVEGDELAEIETTKITNVFEAPTSGLLRRLVVAKGETVTVGGLLAVAAEADVDDAAIDAFISEFQASFVSGEADAASGPALERETVAVGSLEINTVAAGAAGPSVVLVHGFSGDADSWALNIVELRQRARVIAIDLPGHGGSTKDVGDGSVDTLAKAISGALDALGIGSAHLVGHSLGGAVVLRLAQLHPERVISLVLVAPAGLPGGRLNREFLDGMVDAQRAREIRPWLELLFHNPARASAEMVENMARYKRIDGVEEALGTIRNGLLAGVAAYPSAGTVALPPVLLLLGESDQVVGLPDLALLPPDWKVVTLSGAGHMPMVEQFAEFNRLVGDFVSEHS